MVLLTLTPTHNKVMVMIKKLFALILLTTLPAISYGALSSAWVILAADIPGVPIPIDIQQLASDKSMATWFLTMGAIAIGSWTWIFRWLLTQLADQRIANAALVQKLLDRGERDNEKLAMLLERTVAVLDHVQAKLHDN